MFVSTTTMARRTSLKIYTNGASYLYCSSRFVYEVTNYRIYKDRVELAGSKFFGSDRPLIVPPTKYKRTKEFTLIKEIEWIAAPKEYLIKNKYSEWVKPEKRKIKKSNS